MNKQKGSESFSGFDYPISEVRKYIRAGDIFTIMLKNGLIIDHTTQDHTPFEEWLKKHEIVDIKANR